MVNGKHRVLIVDDETDFAEDTALFLSDRFQCEVVGDPSTFLTFKGWHPESIAAGLERNPGVIATGMHCVSAVPQTCEADQGIKTYLDLPFIVGRAAPHLLPGGKS